MVLYNCFAIDFNCFLLKEYIRVPLERKQHILKKGIRSYNSLNMNISKSEMQAMYSCTPNIGKCVCVYLNLN